MLQRPTVSEDGSDARVELLDVVRGLALLGIVSANMVIYSLYMYLPPSAKAAMVTHASDRVLDFLELMLIEGKFYTIFSVLFGVGFSVMVSRARAKAMVFRRFYLRRVVFLFLMGAAHAILIWHVDILQAYAVCGVLLLPLVAARDRIIVTLSVLALLTPMAIQLAGEMPTSALTNLQDALFDRFGLSRETMIDTWTRGSPSDIVRLNLIQVLSQVSFLLTSGMIFKIYGCFLLGFSIGRHEPYRTLEPLRPVLRRVAIGGFAMGLPFNAVYALTFESGSWMETLSSAFGILPLSAAYVASCCLIWLTASGRDRLRLFAPVGRMALTNYIGQSVICTLIFYGTGLGLGGIMGPTLYLPIGLGVYAMQVLASQWWLERYSFGPLEWLWRMFTYGERLPLRRRRAMFT